MSLDDLGSDTEVKNGSKKRYVEITEEEMREFFRDRPESWQEAGHPSKELVMETHDFAPDNDDLVLYCFTTIDERSDKSRKKGADAIRLVAWFDRAGGGPIGGRKKTLRIKTWKKNLSEKTESLMDQGKDAGQICKRCSSIMVRREGEYGEFLGCINFPDCDVTERIE